MGRDPPPASGGGRVEEADCTTVAVGHQDGPPRPGAADPAGAGVLAAGAQPGPVAGADRAVAGPGPAVDGEADSAAAVAAGRAGRRAHGAPVCGGVEGGDGTEGGLRAPQRASWDDDGGRLRRIVGRGCGSAAEGQVPGGDAALQQRVCRQGVSARAARVAARRDRVGVHVFRRCCRPGGARQHVVGGQGGAGRPGPA